MRRAASPALRPGATAALGVLALLAAAAPAWAEPIQVTVSRNQATTEDQIGLFVQVENSNEPPVLPDLPDFDVYSRGQSARTQIINGRRSYNVIHQFVLVPKRVGTFRIGPATVQIDGQVYSSRAFNLKIVDPSSQPAANRDLFVSAQVSEQRPFVGQQVIYTWRFFYRVRIADANLEPQSFDGFVSERLGDVREYTTVVGGQEFYVSEMRVALFPQSAGTISIPGSRLTTKVVTQGRGRRSIFDDVFGRGRAEAKVLTSPPIELDVRPLPAAPQGFSGLVGDFDLKAELSQKELAVGESATLSIRVSGTGNVQMISEPELPDLSAFKIYDDQPTSSINRKGNALTGSKSFRKALVPLTPGELTVPSISLTFFDPETGSYRTDATPRIALAVRPAEGKEELRLTESVAPTTGKVAVRILADDILPLRKGVDTVASTVRGSFGSLLTGAGLGLPLLAFLAALFARRRRDEHARDRGLRRRRTALKRALAGLGQATSGEDVARRLSVYVGDKLGLTGAALTAEETARHLAERSVPNTLVRRVHRVLESLEAARYGGAPGGGESPNNAAALVRELDRHLEDRR